MSGATARKPWRTARIDLPADVLQGRPLGRPFFFSLPPCGRGCRTKSSRVRGLSPRMQTPHPARFRFTPSRHPLPQGEREGKRMTDYPATSVTQSAMRGLSCKCPRCGRGRLYAGFLNLRPNCVARRLDYAFIDSGDGPAVFIIIIAGAVAVGCPLI